jgi:LytS/YehU family sensor histidine kinase
MRESVSTLDKELKATQLYIHLEQLQFDDGFELRIIDQLKTPQSRIKTPTMFLQLFIENAIIHGLKNSTEEKPVLTLLMQETETDYVFTVGDNGPGLQETPKTGHKSVGLTLLRERFKLKSELYQWHIDFEIKENKTVTDDIKTYVTITIGKNWNEPV